MPDDRIPCFAELSEWPIQPKRPGRIVACGRLRDGGPRGGTFFVVLAGENGRDLPLFFDKFLGRLCFGKDAETDEDAAFLKKGSRIEIEAFALLQASASRSDEFSEVLECLAHARTWI